MSMSSETVNYEDLSRNLDTKNFSSNNNIIPANNRDNLSWMSYVDMIFGCTSCNAIFNEQASEVVVVNSENNIGNQGNNNDKK